MIKEGWFVPTIRLANSVMATRFVPGGGARTQRRNLGSSAFPQFGPDSGPYEEQPLGFVRRIRAVLSCIAHVSHDPQRTKGAWGRYSDPVLRALGAEYRPQAPARSNELGSFGAWCRTVGNWVRSARRVAGSGIGFVRHVVSHGRELGSFGTSKVKVVRQRHWFATGEGFSVGDAAEVAPETHAVENGKITDEDLPVGRGWRPVGNGSDERRALRLRLRRRHRPGDWDARRSADGR